jgi:MoxR-like ATPase
MPTDEELSHALKTIRAAAKAAGHKAEMVDDLDELMAAALQHAAQLPAVEAETIRAAIGTAQKWKVEARKHKRKH